MAKDDLKETPKHLRIVNMFKGEKGYVLVTEDDTKLGEQNKFDGWVLMSQEELWSIEEAE